MPARSHAPSQLRYSDDAAEKRNEQRELCDGGPAYLGRKVHAGQLSLDAVARKQDHGQRDVVHADTQDPEPDESDTTGQQESAEDQGHDASEDELGADDPPPAQAPNARHACPER
jgi:hypothetical protein